MRLFIDDNSKLAHEFQIATDMHPELSRTNPFITNEGSQSIPFSLPATENNLKLIKFSYRGTSTNRPPRKMPVILSDQSTFMKGTLFINDVNRVEGINCTFYTSEGRLYETIKNFKLNELGWPKKTGSGRNMPEKAQYWMKEFVKIMDKGETAISDYLIFSVTTDYQFVTFYDVPEESAEYQTLIINQTGYSISEGVIFLAMDSREYKDGLGEGATTYTVPVGYGVTPFLRVGFILRHLFEYFGYELATNIFDTYLPLRRVCLLNNTADAIVTGVLDYSQLLPSDITVEDFINIIRKKFSVEFIEKNGVISVKTWNDILDMSPDMDLSKYIRNYQTWVAQDKKSIYIEYSPIKDLPPNARERYTLVHESSEEMEEEDLSTNDKIPFEDISPILFTGTDPHKSFIYLTAPFIGDISHKNTELIITGESGAKDENDGQLDVMFCFSIPDKQKHEYYDNYYYFAGTVWSYDNSDTSWGDLSLVANEIPLDINPSTKATDNIYNKFYEKRDNMLKYANQQINYEAIIPSQIIEGMDISTPKIILGQKVLIERIDYVIGQPDLCQITCRTLHQYTD